MLVELRRKAQESQPFEPLRTRTLGSPYREPRPQSPERLQLINFQSVGFDEDGVLRMVAEFRYEPWCCNGSHEIADAVVTLEKTISDASETAERIRDELAIEEYRKDLGSLTDD